jgi:hypothetical protein
MNILGIQSSVISKNMFSQEDLKQLSEKGIGQDAIERQLACFRDGFPFLQLDRAATVHDGIVKLGDAEAENLENGFEKALGSRKVYKFVPASGAATRMFKGLYEFMASDNDGEGPLTKEVFDRLTDFAFYSELKSILDKKGFKEADKKQVASAILLPDGLNYGNLPKGMLLFHRYANDVRTAMEEHLVEGAACARNSDGTVNLHFTVSPEHLEGFSALVNQKKGKYAGLFQVVYHIGYSQQKPATDTIAVDLQNEPVRTASGKLLFRPGGHGALLENLNDIDCDIIFIKNIDNVVPDGLKPATIRYKKALACLLLRLQEKAFAYLRLLRSNPPDEDLLRNISDFLSVELSFRLPEVFPVWPTEKRKDYLFRTLNRPIRVCGMVKNEGEPGGGPFWVRNTDGSTSLQIAESSQIDMGNPHQKAIAVSATHFNPVDLVCAVKDYEGNHFDLLQFRNPDTGFISVKSKDGITLKAQELPGLWNGAMAYWNTVFVETPIETFNPVKTINDLLRPQHQEQ